MIMANINRAMLRLGQAPSVIRETFEYGNARARQIGRKNVFDFSLGNPSVPAPERVTDTLRKLLADCPPVSLHGYTSAPGDLPTRRAVAEDLCRRFSADLTEANIYMTCGAAASLTCTLHALVQPGDEIVVPAPFFPEYRVFAEAAGAVLVPVPPVPGSFQIDVPALRRCLSDKTKAVIVNSPNNPTGVVYTREVLTELSDALTAFSAQRGAPVYLLSDEPYRELVYDGAEVPYLPSLYAATIVCYSYSKSLSLPGERIGYVAVPTSVPDWQEIFAAVCGAGRALGFVCAPSLMQKMIAACTDAACDMAAYRLNRDLLYGALTDCGFSCVHPDGAFYLFVRAPEEDAAAFCRKARQYELLLVPSDSFGCPGYVRLAYCVSTDMIRRSLPAFRQLAESYGLI